jgi:class 3 adenylate cyclase
MTALPHGTVTFAFTDIEGSTALMKRLGDGYIDVLAEHRRLVRGSFAAHDGTEIDSQGDAFFFAFTRASEAVAAAAEVQLAHASHAWAEGAAVRVRIGLHTGEPTLSADGYVGLDVVRAARLCSACRGGQVLLSQSTRALLGSALPDGVDVYPVGQRHLKDIEEPEVVYELGIAGVESSPAEPEPEAAIDERASDPERSFEESMEDWAEGLSTRIQRQVLSSLERSVGRLGGPAKPEGAPGRPPQGPAPREGLSGEIRAMVARALEGTPPKRDSG